jgi:hypothetical protein
MVHVAHTQGSGGGDAGNGRRAVEPGAELAGDHEKGASSHDLQHRKVLHVAKDTTNLTRGPRGTARLLWRHYVRQGGRRSSGERA